MNEAGTHAVALATLQGIVQEIEADALRGDNPLRRRFDLNSMGWLNFLLDLHEKLQVDIPEADYVKLIKLDDVVAYLASRRAAG